MSAVRSVCILYGFCEGPHVGKGFERAIWESGFSIVRDPRQADLIIAHSAGCFLVPKGTSAPVIFIGLPALGGQQLITGYFKNMWRGMRPTKQTHSFRALLTLSAWNLLYFWDIFHSLSLAKGYWAGSWKAVPRLIIVHNTKDAFGLVKVSELPFKFPPAVVSLPGLHSDCWYNPEPYLRMLKSL